MKNKWGLLILMVVCFLQIRAQNSVRMQVIEKDFAIWAYQQHNGICKIIYDKIESKQLASYNAKHVKESASESFDKLKREIIVFVSTDLDDPTVGVDSVIMEPQAENYYFFKQSGDYLLLKPFKDKTNLLKLKKTEVMALMNSEQQQYFKLFSSGAMLCLDSLPKTSRKVFTDFNSQLFAYSQLPNSLVYVNDSLETKLSIEQKKSNSQVEQIYFIADADDPTMGIDTVVYSDYNIRDTNINQAIIAAFEVNGVALKVKALATGMSRLQGQFQNLVSPYGFIPYSDAVVFNREQWQVLNAVMNYKICDRVNERSFYDEMYNDYFDY
ncbi:MAG: hypothetical protein PSX81_12580 [bacterium]|nr:hypothetical protein [bacterium]